MGRSGGAQTDLMTPPPAGESEADPALKVALHAGQPCLVLQTLGD